ncbi:MAG: hypothetical protein H8D23_15270 [Candidatus Brocadiales bacterium]|nr:hypothetical protein [Candidatus Brocadiales bacterium]
MSNFSDIQQVFNVKLSSLTGLPLWKRENLNLDPDEDEVYITSKLLPAQTNFPNVGSNGFRVESGTFEIQVKAVRNTGWGTYSDLVDDILEHFPRNLYLTSSPDSGEDEIIVKVIKSYPLEGYFDSNGRYSIPVHIRYETYILI